MRRACQLPCLRVIFHDDRLEPPLEELAGPTIAAVEDQEIASRAARRKELQALLAALRAGDLQEMPKDAGDGGVDKADK
jgi:hypothetical protein